jgi:hypothetical protein
MLEGRNVSLRVMEKDDVDFMVECRNNPNYSEFDNFTQISRAERLRAHARNCTEISSR